MSKRRVIVLVCLAAVVLAFFGLRAASYPFALISKGMFPNDASMLSRGFNPNGDEYRVVQSSTTKSNHVLAYLVQNKWGFWSVWNITGNQIPDVDYATIAWTNTGGLRIFSLNDDPEMYFEQHLLIVGDNAIQKIELPRNLLPDNVAADISQSTDYYKIHLVTYGDTLNNFDLHQLLVDQGYIKP